MTYSKLVLRALAPLLIFVGGCASKPQAGLPVPPLPPAEAMKPPLPPGCYRSQFKATLAQEWMKPKTSQTDSGCAKAP